MGGKAKIAKYFLPIILKDRESNQWFVEPFVGGANVMNKVGGNRIGADINPYMIEFLKTIRDNPNKLPPRITREQYDDIRANPEKYPKALVGFAGSTCSFSGKWFNSFVGEPKFYPSVQRVKDYIQENLNVIQREAPKLKGALFFTASYDELDIPENSIIYCDPPYQGVDQKYHGITNNNFDSEKFFKWCEKMVEKGHSVFVSEHNAPNHWNVVWQKDFKRTLGTSISGVSVTDKVFQVTNRKLLKGTSA